MLIKDILIKNTLNEFYDLYMKHGKGIIVNHTAGSFIYDHFSKETGKIDLSDEVKSNVKKECINNFNLYYSYLKRYSIDEKKKVFNIFYKSKLAEYKLNSFLEKDFSGEILDSTCSITDIFLKKESDNISKQQLLSIRNNIDKLMIIMDL